MASTSRRSSWLMSGRNDTPADVAERIAYRAACERANTEMQDRFAPLTPENFCQATEWQRRRIGELLAEAR